MIRSFATMIEDEFPDIQKKNFTPSKVKTKGHSKHRIDRLYRFRKILLTGLRRKNEYVMCIMEGVDTEYKAKYNITTIDKRSKNYERFLFRFCDSVTKAIEHGNRYLAHLLTGGGVTLSVIGEYYKVVDGHMVTFYNSLIATDLAEKAVEEIEGELSPEKS